MSASMGRTSFAMILLGIAGIVALILGLVGVYGVISYAVSQRSRELGMRMALGAQPGQVKGMVLRQGFALAGVGVVLGLGLAFGITRLMSSLLVGVSPADPLTYTSVAVRPSGRCSSGQLHPRQPGSQCRSHDGLEDGLRNM